MEYDTPRTPRSKEFVFVTEFAQWYITTGVSSGLEEGVDGVEDFAGFCS